MKWTNPSVYQTLLEQKFDTGAFDADTKPKDAYVSEPAFQKFKLDLFRGKFNNEKKKRGLHLQMVQYQTDGDPEKYDDVEESPPKKPKILKCNVSANLNITLPLLTETWYESDTAYNNYVVSPWSHPKTGINYVDLWILLPTGVSHIEQFEVKISECATKKYITIAWSNDFTNKDILVKTGKEMDSELTDIRQGKEGVLH